MPEEGVKLIRHDEMLTFEEIADVVKAAVDLGINKIRLTGGEPLVRRDLPVLVALIAGIPGVRDLSLTTNGYFLKEHAVSLKAAGLHRVNVSLDTLDPEKYKWLTRGGDISRVLEGIQAARNAGLDPVKINCVVFNSSDEQDTKMVKDYADREGLQVRFIRQMNLETGEFSVVEGGIGGNCSICNRLRMTARGMVKPCLFDGQEFPVRLLGAKNALMQALHSKPKEGCLNEKDRFYNIGG
jgi:cyclic pyranopterin phosphate synthase